MYLVLRKILLMGRNKKKFLQEEILMIVIVDKIVLDREIY